MKRRRISTALAGVAVTCALGAAVWPHARDAGRLLAAQDDPAALAETQVSSALRNNQKIVSDNIEQALAKGDADLAASFVELAGANHVAVSDDLSRRVREAVAEEKSTSHLAKQFATGLVTGNADDVASLSGTVTGDLFVFGDIRDVVRETKHLAMGEETDRLVLGLATAGLAVTAATYVSVGGAAPVRAGLSLVKDARKVGRLGEGLAEWAGRSARDVVDTPVLEEAVASSSVLHPGDSVSAISAAFRAEKAGALVRLAKDVGRITEKVGTRGALDTLKIAEGPKDVSRAARLAEAEGGKTRAILKILGRGALLLLGGAFDLTLWLISALLALFGVLATIKSTTERATQAWLDRRKSRRLRKQMAAAKAEARVAAARVAVAAA
jgi:ATP-dependent protease HslVU (ClpYQ) peptidase subunit